MSFIVWSFILVALIASSFLMFNLPPVGKLYDLASKLTIGLIMAIVTALIINRMIQKSEKDRWRVIFNDLALKIFRKHADLPQRLNQMQGSYPFQVRMTLWAYEISEYIESAKYVAIHCYDPNVFKQLVLYLESLREIDKSYSTHDFNMSMVLRINDAAGSLYDSLKLKNGELEKREVLWPKDLLTNISEEIKVIKWD
jgi:hypothetical protein